MLELLLRANQSAGSTGRASASTSTWTLQFKRLLLSIVYHLHHNVTTQPLLSLSIVIMSDIASAPSPIPSPPAAVRSVASEDVVARKVGSHWAFESRLDET